MAKTDQGPTLAGPKPDIALAERLFDELKARTGGPAGITRASYGEGEAIAHELVIREAERLGLAWRRDPAANLFVTLAGRNAGPAIMIGSHLDSVPSGGNFDGAAGVLAGLSVMAGFIEAGVTPLRDIVLAVFRAEESAWFNASYIGSRAALGPLDPTELDSVRRSDDGRSLGEHMRDAGADLAALRAGTAVLDLASIAAFIEPHIEQGPVLVSQGQPMAIVTGIRGSARFRQVVCRGDYAHSGATPRALRRDAVLAAADLTLSLNRLWREREEASEDIVLTVGQFATDPTEHAFSKVAGRVDLSIDLRSASEALLSRAPGLISEIASEVAERHDVAVELGALSSTRPAIMDREVNTAGPAGAIASSPSLNDGTGRPMTERTPPMNAPLPRLLPCGDAAISVKFGAVIDPALNARPGARCRPVGAASRRPARDRADLSLPARAVRPARLRYPCPEANHSRAFRAPIARARHEPRRASRAPWHER